MNSKAVLTATLIGILAAGSLAYGQFRFGRRLADSRGADRGRAMAFVGGYLDLEDEQKSRFAEIVGATAAATAADRDLLKVGRQELSEAARSGADEQQLRQMAERQGVILGRLIGEIAVAGSQMHAELTPEQQEKASELRELIQSRIGRMLAGE